LKFCRLRGGAASICSLIRGDSTAYRGKGLKIRKGGREGKSAESTPPDRASQSAAGRRPGGELMPQGKVLLNLQKTKEVFTFSVIAALGGVGGIGRSNESRATAMVITEGKGKMSPRRRSNSKKRLKRGGDRGESKRE